MTSFERMIVQQYPYAEPGEDFTVKTGEDGNPIIGYWNTEKLGSEPSLIQLHTAYMQWAEKKKSMLPTFDDSDPAPWLNSDQMETRMVMTTNEVNNVPVDEYITYPNGMTLKKVR